MLDDGQHARVELARTQHCKVARTSPDAFVTYVMRDAVTNLPVVQAPMHRAWQHGWTMHDQLLIWSHLEAGKTTQLCARILYDLGNDPTLRWVYLANTVGQAQKPLKTIAQYIGGDSEGAKALHEVFPDLLPAKDEPWSQTRLHVWRPTISKDESVRAYGVHGSVTGARIDRLVIDDILDWENTRSPRARKELWDWLFSEVMGRLSERGRVYVIGNAYHPDDALHRFAKMKGVIAWRYPVMDEHGESRWPQAWPKERIEAARQKLGPLEFARQLMCVPRADSEARFKSEWIDVCKKRGLGLKLLPSSDSLPGSCRLFTGVDLAVQQHAAADKTVLFTIAVYPDGSRQVIGIESGKWTGPEILHRIVEAHARYRSIVIVENNASQDFIRQFTNSMTAVPIKPFTTGRNKAHPEFGIESLATEMAIGKWIIPNIDGALEPEVAAWIEGMLYYDPQAHTSDHLMASWFAREGAREDTGQVVEFGRLRLRR